MDNGIYLATAILTIVWSVRLYMSWHDKGALKEESGLRYATIFMPVIWFLAIIFIGLGQMRVVKLDIVGLLMLDGITVIALITSFLVLGRFRKSKGTQRQGFLVLIWGYNILGLIIAVLMLILRRYPVILIRVTNLFYQLTSVDLLSFTWIGGSGEAREQDFISMLNKILIALLSYIPVSLVRFFAIRYQRIQTKKELDKLKFRVDNIESYLKTLEDSKK